MNIDERLNNILDLMIWQQWWSITFIVLVLLYCVLWATIEWFRDKYGY